MTRTQAETASGRPDESRAEFNPGASPGAAACRDGHIALSASDSEANGTGPRGSGGARLRVVTSPWHCQVTSLRRPPRPRRRPGPSLSALATPATVLSLVTVYRVPLSAAGARRATAALRLFTDPRWSRSRLQRQPSPPPGRA